MHKQDATQAFSDYSIRRMPHASQPALETKDVGIGAAGATIDSLGRRWVSALHPRDSRGRFIETGGVVRVWGREGLARVLRPLPGNRVEVQWEDGSREVHSAYRVTMVARPDGSKPTRSKKQVLAEDGRRDADPQRPTADYAKGIYDGEDHGNGTDVTPIPKQDPKNEDEGDTTPDYTPTRAEARDGDYGIETRRDGKVIVGRIQTRPGADFLEFATHDGGIGGAMPTRDFQVIPREDVKPEVLDEFLKRDEGRLANREGVKPETARRLVLASLDDSDHDGTPDHADPTPGDKADTHWDPSLTVSAENKRRADYTPAPVDPDDIFAAPAGAKKEPLAEDTDTATPGSDPLANRAHRLSTGEFTDGSKPMKFTDGLKGEELDRAQRLREATDKWITGEQNHDGTDRQMDPDLLKAVAGAPTIQTDLHRGDIDRHLKVGDTWDESPASWSADSGVAEQFAEGLHSDQGRAVYTIRGDKRALTLRGIIDRSDPTAESIAGGKFRVTGVEQIDGPDGKPMRHYVLDQVNPYGEHSDSHDGLDVPHAEEAHEPVEGTGSKGAASRQGREATAVNTNILPGGRTRMNEYGAHRDDAIDAGKVVRDKSRPGKFYAITPEGRALKGGNQSEAKQSLIDNLNGLDVPEHKPAVKRGTAGEAERALTPNERGVIEADAHKTDLAAGVEAAIQAEDFDTADAKLNELEALDPNYRVGNGDIAGLRAGIAHVREQRANLAPTNKENHRDADRGDQSGSPVLGDVSAQQGGGDSGRGSGDVLPGAGAAGDGGDRGRDGGESAGRGAAGDRSDAAASTPGDGRGEGTRGDAGGDGVPAGGAGHQGSGAADAAGVRGGRGAADRGVDKPAPVDFDPRGLGNLVPTTPEGKVEANLEALRLLRKLQHEDRNATPAEQLTLAKFSGWGSLPQVFTHGKGFDAQREELKTLMSPKDYEEAMQNAVNAHYTDPRLVDPIWDALRDLGFDKGDVLEAGSGSGNFIGYAPPGAHMHGVELNEVTASISKLLYPSADIRNEGFEKSRVVPGMFDAMIGNVPFANAREHDPEHNPNRAWLTHDHFVSKGLTSLKPGGIAAVITSAGTLDKQDASHREAMYAHSDLVAAIRLPGNAHAEAAGTSVVTDLLIFRKRKPGEAPGDGSWVHSSPMTLADGTTRNINDYFQGHSENVLGSMESVSGRHGAEQSLGVHGDVKNLPTNLRDALGKVAQDARAEGKTYAPEEVIPDATTAKAKKATSSRGTRKAAGAAKAAEDVSYDPTLYAGPSERTRKRPKVVGQIDLAGVERVPGKKAGSKGSVRYHFTKIGYDHKPEEYVPDGASSASGVAPKKGERNPNQADELARLIQLRDLNGDLQDAERETFDDTPEIKTLRAKLNKAYDAYSDSYGAIGRTKISRRKVTVKNPEDSNETEDLFQEDGQWYAETRTNPAMGGMRKDPTFWALTGLEKEYNEQTNTATKADRFTKRTVRKAELPDHADTPADAVAISREHDGRIDLDRIAGLLGIDRKDVLGALGDEVFTDHRTGELMPRHLYLAGDTRQKVKELAALAAKDPEKWTPALMAMRSAVPPDKDPTKITVTLGAPWIPAADVQDFMRFLTGNDFGEVVQDREGKWTVKTPKRGARFAEREGGSGMVAPRDWDGRTPLKAAWGTKRRNTYDLVETLLKGQRPVVTDKDPETKKDVYNKAETEAAQAVADKIAGEFGKWLWRDPARRDRLHSAYNDQYRSYTDVNYVDSPEREYVGMTDAIDLDPHQNDAVHMAIDTPATLLHHEVGTGKTFTMAAAIMELKRLGQVDKPVLVVPNHMLEQFVREFKQLYPDANLLATDSHGMSPDNRRAFVAQAAYSDWDAVVMTKSAFARLPLDETTVAKSMEEELDKLREKRDDALEKGDTKAVKAIGTQIKNKKGSLEELQARLKSDVGALDFRTAGFDYVVVDEAHEYKNDLVESNMRQLAKVQPNLAAVDLRQKLDFLREENPKRGKNKVALFATGTPVSNSTREFYVMARFLRPELLKEAGVSDFDDFAKLWLGMEEQVETDVAGNIKVQVREGDRLVNAGEMKRLWVQFADEVTADDVGIERPKLAGGKANQVITEASDNLKQFVKHLGVRKASIKPSFKPKPGEDTHVAVGTDGLIAAVDLRLISDKKLYEAGIDPRTLTEEDSKIPVVGKSILDEWHRTKDMRFKVKKGSKEDHPNPGAAQIVFVDKGIPAAGQEGKHSFYDALKAHLVENGMRPDEVAFIHDAGGDSAKLGKIMERVRTGEVKVLIGSTALMGTGLNVQNRLSKLHHVDGSYRPDQIEQRNGRILRRGNQMAEVSIDYYPVAGSTEGFQWGHVARKDNFLRQFSKADLDATIVGRPDDGASESEFLKAAAANNPLLMDDAVVEKAWRTMENEADAHQASIEYHSNNVEQGGQKVHALEQAISKIEGAAQNLTETAGDKFKFKGEDFYDPKLGRNVRGTEVTDRKDAAEVLAATVERMTGENAYVPNFGPGRAEPFAVLGGQSIYAQTYSPGMGRKPVVRFFVADPTSSRYNPQPLRLGQVEVDPQKKIDHNTVVRLENLVQSMRTAPDSLREDIATTKESMKFSAVEMQNTWENRGEHEALKKRREALKELLKFRAGAESRPVTDPKEQQRQAQQYQELKDAYTEATKAYNAIRDQRMNNGVTERTVSLGATRTSRRKVKAQNKTSERVSRGLPSEPRKRRAADATEDLDGSTKETTGKARKGSGGLRKPSGTSGPSGPSGSRGERKPTDPNAPKTPRTPANPDTEKQRVDELAEAAAADTDAQIAEELDGPKTPEQIDAEAEAQAYLDAPETGEMGPTTEDLPADVTPEPVVPEDKHDDAPADTPADHEAMAALEENGHLAADPDAEHGGNDAPQLGADSHDELYAEALSQWQEENGYDEGTTPEDVDDEEGFDAFLESLQAEQEQADAQTGGTLSDYGIKLSPAELATLRNATEDHAAGYAQFGDPARYVAEGHLKDLVDEHGLGPVWEAVDRHLEANPEVGKWTPEQIAANKAKRTEAIAAIDKRAEAAMAANDYPELLNLLDEIEAIDPAHTADGHTIEQLRAGVRQMMKDSATPETASDRPTDGTRNSSGTSGPSGPSGPSGASGGSGSGSGKRPTAGGTDEPAGEPAGKPIEELMGQKAPVTDDEFARHVMPKAIQEALDGRKPESEEDWQRVGEYAASIRAMYDAGEMHKPWRRTDPRERRGAIYGQNHPVTDQEFDTHIEPMAHENWHERNGRDPETPEEEADRDREAQVLREMYEGDHKSWRDASTDDPEGQSFDNGDDVVTHDGREGYVVGVDHDKGTALVNIDGTYDNLPLANLAHPGSTPANPVETPKERNDRLRAEKVAQAATPEGWSFTESRGLGEPVPFTLCNLDVEAGHGEVTDADGNLIGWIRARKNKAGRDEWHGVTADGQHGLSWVEAPDLAAQGVARKSLDKPHTITSMWGSKPELFDFRYSDAGMTRKQSDAIGELNRTEPDWWKAAAGDLTGGEKARAIAAELRRRADELDNGDKADRAKARVLRGAARTFDVGAHRLDSMTLPRPGEKDPYRNGIPSKSTLPDEGADESGDLAPEQPAAPTPGESSAPTQVESTRSQVLADLSPADHKFLADLMQKGLTDSSPEMRAVAKKWADGETLPQEDLDYLVRLFDTAQQIETTQGNAKRAGFYKRLAKAVRDRARADASADLDAAYQREGARIDALSPAEAAGELWDRNKRIADEGVFESYPRRDRLVTAGDSYREQVRQWIERHPNRDEYVQQNATGRAALLATDADRVDLRGDDLRVGDRVWSVKVSQSNRRDWYAITGIEKDPEGGWTVHVDNPKNPTLHVTKDETVEVHAETARTVDPGALPDEKPAEAPVVEAVRNEHNPETASLLSDLADAKAAITALTRTHTSHGGDRGGDDYHAEMDALKEQHDAVVAKLRKVGRGPNGGYLDSATNLQVGDRIHSRTGGVYRVNHINDVWPSGKVTVATTQVEGDHEMPHLKPGFHMGAYDMIEYADPRPNAMTPEKYDASTRRLEDLGVGDNIVYDGRPATIIKRNGKATAQFWAATTDEHGQPVIREVKGHLDERWFLSDKPGPDMEMPAKWAVGDLLKVGRSKAEWEVQKVLADGRVLLHADDGKNGKTKTVDGEDANLSMLHPVNPTEDYLKTLSPQGMEDYAKSLRSRGWGSQADQVDAHRARINQRDDERDDAVTEAVETGLVPDDEHAAENLEQATAETEVADEAIADAKREGEDDQKVEPELPDAEEANTDVPGEYSGRILVEDNGSTTYVTGTDFNDPTEIRDALKAARFRWDRDKKRWYKTGDAVTRAAAAEKVREALKAADAKHAAENPAEAPAKPKFPPTPEQRAILDAFKQRLNIVVRALAGTGKTTTMTLLADAMPKSHKALYVAFNTSIKDEARRKFGKNVKVMTADALAFHALPSQEHKKRIMEGFKRPDDVARTIGINAPVKRTDGPDLSPSEAAVAVVATINKWAISADAKMGAKHLPENVADDAEAAKAILAYANKAWENDYTKPNGKLLFTHQHSRKMWALGNPKLDYDVIFFDEAQDANDVLAGVLKGQQAQTVVVGDSNQSIYGFIGASDQLDKWKADAELELTTTWRAGQVIAGMGNRFLQLTGTRMRLKGNPNKDGRILAPNTMENADAVLTRTNAGAVAEIAAELDAGRRVATAGDAKDLYKFARGAKDLIDGKRTANPELAQFANWHEVREFADQTGDASLRTMIRLVDERGAQGLLDLLDRLVPETSNPDVVVSTAHKAKGREWPRVRIGTDFKGPEEDENTGELKMPSAEELRLNYVAVTRAEEELDLGSLAWVLNHTDENGGTPADAPSATAAAEKATPEAPKAPEAPETSSGVRTMGDLKAGDKLHWDGDETEVIDATPAGPQQTLLTIKSRWQRKPAQVTVRNDERAWLPHEEAEQARAAELEKFATEHNLTPATTDDGRTVYLSPSGNLAFEANRGRWAREGFSVWRRNADDRPRYANTRIIDGTVWDSAVSPDGASIEDVYKYVAGHPTRDYADDHVDRFPGTTHLVTPDGQIGERVMGQGPIEHLTFANTAQDWARRTFRADDLRPLEDVEPFERTMGDLKPGDRFTWNGQTWTYTRKAPTGLDSGHASFWAKPDDGGKAVNIMADPRTAAPTPETAEKSSVDLGEDVRDQSESIAPDTTVDDSGLPDDLSDDEDGEGTFGLDDEEESAATKYDPAKVDTSRMSPEQAFDAHQKAWDESSSDEYRWGRTYGDTTDDLPLVYQPREGGPTPGPVAEGYTEKSFEDVKVGDLVIVGNSLDKDEAHPELVIGVDREPDGTYAIRTLPTEVDKKAGEFGLGHHLDTKRHPGMRIAVKDDVLGDDGESLQEGRAAYNGWAALLDPKVKGVRKGLREQLNKLLRPFGAGIEDWKPEGYEPDGPHSALIRAGQLMPGMRVRGYAWSKSPKWNELQKVREGRIGKFWVHGSAKPGTVHDGFGFDLLDENGNVIGRKDVGPDSWVSVNPEDMHLARPVNIEDDPKFVVDGDNLDKWEGNRTDWTEPGHVPAFGGDVWRRRQALFDMRRRAGIAPLSREERDADEEAWGRPRWEDLTRRMREGGQRYAKEKAERDARFAERDAEAKRRKAELAAMSDDDLLNARDQATSDGNYNQRDGYNYALRDRIDAHLKRLQRRKISDEDLRNLAENAETYSERRAAADLLRERDAADVPNPDKRDAPEPYDAQQGAHDAHIASRHMDDDRLEEFRREQEEAGHPEAAAAAAEEQERRRKVRELQDERNAPEAGDAGNGDGNDGHDHTAVAGDDSSDEHHDNEDGRDHHDRPGVPGNGPDGLPDGGGIDNPDAVDLDVPDNGPDHHDTPEGDTNPDDHDLDHHNGDEENRDGDFWRRRRRRRRHRNWPNNNNDNNNTPGGLPGLVPPPVVPAHTWSGVPGDGSGHGGHGDAGDDGFVVAPAGGRGIYDAPGTGAPITNLDIANAMGEDAVAGDALRRSDLERLSDAGLEAVAKHIGDELQARDERNQGRTDAEDSRLWREWHKIGQEKERRNGGRDNGHYGPDELNLHPRSDAAKMRAEDNPLPEAADAAIEAAGIHPDSHMLARHYWNTDHPYGQLDSNTQHVLDRLAAEHPEAVPFVRDGAADMRHRLEANAGEVADQFGEVMDAAVANGADAAQDAWYGPKRKGGGRAGTGGLVNADTLTGVNDATFGSIEDAAQAAEKAGVNPDVVRRALEDVAGWDGTMVTTDRGSSVQPMPDAARLPSDAVSSDAYWRMEEAQSNPSPQRAFIRDLLANGDHRGENPLTNPDVPQSVRDRAGQLADQFTAAGGTVEHHTGENGPGVRLRAADTAGNWVQVDYSPGAKNGAVKVEATRNGEGGKPKKLAAKNVPAELGTLGTPAEPTAQQSLEDLMHTAPEADTPNVDTLGEHEVDRPEHLINGALPLETGLRLPGSGPDEQYEAAQIDYLAQYGDKPVLAHIAGHDDFQLGSFENLATDGKGGWTAQFRPVDSHGKDDTVAVSDKTLKALARVDAAEIPGPETQPGDLKPGTLIWARDPQTRKWHLGVLDSVTPDGRAAFHDSMGEYRTKRGEGVHPIFGSYGEGFAPTEEFFAPQRGVWTPQKDGFTYTGVPGLYRARIHPDGHKWEIHGEGPFVGRNEHGERTDELGPKWAVRDVLESWGIERGAPVTLPGDTLAERDRYTHAHTADVAAITGIEPAPTARDHAPEPEGKPQDVHGTEATWVANEALHTGDVGRVTGDTDGGDTTSRTGHIVSEPEPVKVNVPGQPTTEGTRTTVAETPAGGGDRGTVLAPEGSVSARVDRQQGPDQADPTANPESAAESEILAGTIPEQMPRDKFGRGIFPGSIVTLDGGGQGMVMESGENGVMVRWDGEKDNTATRPGLLQVAEEGVRPAGWTPEGTRVKPGLIVAGDGLETPGIVQAVTGDTAVIETPDGPRQHHVGDLRVTGTAFPEDDTAPVRVAGGRLGDVKIGDLLLLPGGDGKVRTVEVIGVSPVRHGSVDLEVADPETGLVERLTGDVEEDASQLTHLDGTPVSLPGEQRHAFDAPTGPEGLDVRQVEPFPIDALPEGTPADHPIFDEGDRTALVDLGLDTDSVSGYDVQQGAARVRARMPLSPAQSHALAEHLRNLAQGGMPKKQARVLNRLANRLEASAQRGEKRAPLQQAAVTGEAVPSTVGDLTHGDQAALNGPDGLLVGEVIDATPTAGGHVTAVTIEDADGERHTLAMPSDAPAHRLPDLPETDDQLDVPSPTEEERQLGARIDTRVTDAAAAAVQAALDKARGVDDATNLADLANHVVHQGESGADDRDQANATDRLNSSLERAGLDPEVQAAAREAAAQAAQQAIEAAKQMLEQSVEGAEPLPGETPEQAAERWKARLREVLAETDVDALTREAVEMALGASTADNPALEAAHHSVRDAARADLHAFADELAAAGEVEVANVLSAIAARLAGNPAQIHVQAALDALTPLTPNGAPTPALTGRVRAAMIGARRRFLDRVRTAMGTGKRVRRTLAAAIKAAKASWHEEEFNADATGLVDAARTAAPGNANEPTGYTERLAHWAAQLPASIDGFGRREVTGPTWRGLTTEALDGGRTVTANLETRTRLDRARDGGPGKTALAHLSAVKGLGGAVLDEANARVRAVRPELGPDPAGMVAEARRHADELERMAMAPGAGAEAIARAKAARVEADQASQAYADAFADAALALLGERRPMGGNLEVVGRGKDAEEVAALRWAAQHVPADWLAKLGPLEAYTGPQGGYNAGKVTVAPTGPETRTGAGEYGRSALHGLGHALEDVMPGLSAAEWAYQFTRTSAADRSRRGENAMGSLADRFKALGLRRSEVTRKGDLPDAFLGVEHDGHSFWELIALSYEDLFAGNYYADDDLRQFMLGLLAWMETH